MSEERSVELTLQQVDGYEFRIRFDGTALPELTTDEAAPLGHDAGPNPAQLVLAAVANCLSASLLFALRKFRNAPGRLSAKAHAHIARNEHGRWRIGRMEIDIALPDAAASLRDLDRVLVQFEDFCIVTQSVRAGIPVAVRVRDGGGELLHSTTAGA
ncbi:MAG TPA: OsmC family protein [Gammaproteobacteria bacterium]|jgi:uncharacterized OsmC-like protein|nr:OsmC family protein [Gammaproteobacteria bacterium]